MYVASASQKALWCRGKRGAARSAAEGKKKKRLTCSRVHPSKAKTAGRRCWFRESEI